jgi:hypothetical protein
VSSCANVPRRTLVLLRGPAANKATSQRRLRSTDSIASAQAATSSALRRFLGLSTGDRVLVG